MTKRKQYDPFGFNQAELKTMQGALSGGFSSESNKKPVSIKKRYLQEKQDLDYSKKYKKLKQERAEYNRENREEMINNVRRGASNVRRSAEKVGSGISRLFKPKKKSPYGKKTWGRQ